MNSQAEIGSHLILDFKSIQNVDLKNPAFFDIILSQISSECMVTIISNLTHCNKSDGIAKVYIVENGHLTLHTYPNINSCSIDFYFKSVNSRETLEKVEEIICSLLGWENCSSTILLDRGVHNQVLLNNYHHSSTLYKNFQLIHREKTPYQDIRVFDTNEMGRVLTLDNMIQISELPEDNYTIDLCKLVVTKESNYNNLLIIGAGDMIIPNYLLTNNFKIGKIDLVEIDERVYANTKKYFKGNEQIDKFVADGKLNLVFDDGAKFLKKRKSEGYEYDGIIIDNSDVFIFDGPAASLFTDEFYGNIFNCLKRGACFSQQVSDENVRVKWENMVKSVGFKDILIIYSSTPEYSVQLPMASAKKF